MSLWPNRTMKTQFTIIIPTYNYENLLPNAIESVIAQNHPHKLIIIDDGSTDNTKELIQQYQNKHENITYACQANAGPGAARNHGIKLAQGEYLLFLDADDYLEPGALNAFANHLKQDKTSNMIIGASQHIRQNKPKKIHMPGAFSKTPEENFINGIRGKLKMPTGSYVIHRSVFEKFNYPEQVKHCEDGMLLSHILANFPVCSINDVVVNIRKHDTSLRHQISSNAKAGLDVVDILFNPDCLPAAFFKYKNEYISYRCLDLFRSFLNAGNFATARKYYHQAIRTFPKHLLKWPYLKKYLRGWLTNLKPVIA